MKTQNCTRAYIPKRVDKAFRVLIDSIGGTGNKRYESALVAALVCAPLREALEEAVDNFLADDQGRKEVLASVGL